MQIGDRIRELRVDRDLTQANIANILKTSQGYYSEYELGKRAIPIQHIHLNKLDSYHFSSLA